MECSRCSFQSKLRRLWPSNIVPASWMRFLTKLLDLLPSKIYPLHSFRLIAPISRFRLSYRHGFMGDLGQWLWAFEASFLSLPPSHKLDFWVNRCGLGGRFKLTCGCDLTERKHLPQAKRLSSDSSACRLSSRPHQPHSVIVTRCHHCRRRRHRHRRLTSGA